MPCKDRSLQQAADLPCSLNWNGRRVKGLGFRVHGLGSRVWVGFITKFETLKLTKWGKNNWDPQSSLALSHFEGVGLGSVLG